MNMKIPSLTKLNKTERLYVVQIVITVLLLIFLISRLLSGHTRNVDLKTVTDRMHTISSVTAMKEGSGRDLRKTMRLNDADYDWVLYDFGEGLMDVSELLIVRSDNAAALDTAMAAIESRLDSQKTSFDGYGTNQYDLLTHAVVKRVGDYCFYAVSEDAQKWEEVFLDIVK